MNYIQHLFLNWKVAAHAFKDIFTHFIHGILPFVKIKHHQPVKQGGFNMDLKAKFIKECKNREGDPKYLVIAVKLPNGAIELITNTEKIGEKAEYYSKAYDEYFCLKTNPDIKIIDFMLV